MIDLNSLQNGRLRGRFKIRRVEVAREPLKGPQGEVLGRTSCYRRELEIWIGPALSDKECSVTLYHEVLEALSVTSDRPPLGVREYAESDFENAAYRAHKQFGFASVENLNRMLELYGFAED